MIRNKLHSRLFFALSIVLLSCHNGKDIDNELITDRGFCQTHYKELMLTIPELVTAEFYRKKKLAGFESLDVDTTMASTLHVKYKFKYNDDDYKMQIYNLIISSVMKRK
jgi:hypothetical protein